MNFNQNTNLKAIFALNAKNSSFEAEFLSTSFKAEFSNNTGFKAEFCNTSFSSNAMNFAKNQTQKRSIK